MIDLHLHSTASDGTLSPAELAHRGSDFSVMAITDHDNCDGVGEFLSACSELNIDDTEKIRLAGIELSVEPGAGYDKFHVLGLGIDPYNDGIKRRKNISINCTSAAMARMKAIVFRYVS